MPGRKDPKSALLGKGRGHILKYLFLYFIGRRGRLREQTSTKIIRNNAKNIRSKRHGDLKP